MYNYKNSGFTIIEMIFCITILSIFAIIFTNMIFISIQTNQKADVLLKAILLSNNIMEQVTLNFEKFVTDNSLEREYKDGFYYKVDIYKHQHNLYYVCVSIYKDYTSKQPISSKIKILYK